jgi:beta-fructofuranosidase
LRSSRRAFLKAAAASGSLAVFPAGNGSALEYFLQDSQQARLAADPLRPQFHLLPAKNWMNDPNGPIFWNGLYHMFFQYNPNAAVWGDMHWNHAVSEDMIHWRHLPIALAPTPGSDDADGCFTGSAVNDSGTATILYTGVKTTTPDRATLRDGNHNFREVQCLATSSDPQLRTWNKWREPVIQPPGDPKLTGFRDPFLWKDETSKTWYLGVASGIFRQGGLVRLYRSNDLRNWEYLHPLATGHWTEKDNINPVDSGEMWECPDFFPLGKKHVLLYSTAGQVIWETGELDPIELVFHPQKRGILDHGAYYAQKTQLDAKGNRILWGWIPEKRPDSELIAAGWAGCLALPRILSIGKTGNLLMQVAPEAESLRAKAFIRSPQHAPITGMLNSAGDIKIENLCGEILWRALNSPCTYTLEDKTGVWCSIEISVKGSSPGRVSVNGISAELPVFTFPGAEFHLFVDGSVIELLCARTHAFTVRVYRQPNGPLRFRPTEDPLRAFSYLQAWQLRPISSDRLTT